MIKTFLALSLTTFAPKPPLKVAVIDTGFTESAGKISRCKEGDKDFTGEGLDDYFGHGINISGLIDKYAKNSSYCQIIIKYYPGKNSSDKTLEYTIQAFKYAISLNVDFINYSSSGGEFSKEEQLVIKEALDKGITVIVPSGNNNKNLDIKCDEYPACHDSRLIVVGRNDFSAKKRKNFGYGKVVDVYEDGYEQTALGITQSGTSQATAITTGKLIKQRSENGSNSRR